MDTLDTAIKAILAEAELPDDDVAVERVREDIEIAQERTRDIGPMALKVDEAIQIEQATKVILRLARDYPVHLGTAPELAYLRGLQTAAAYRLNVGGKPMARDWVGPCAALFKGAWESLTQRPSGIYVRSEPSPTLLFATACCNIVDPTVSWHMVLRAYIDLRKNLGEGFLPI